MEHPYRDKLETFSGTKDVSKIECKFYFNSYSDVITNVTTKIFIGEWYITKRKKYEFDNLGAYKRTFIASDEITIITARNRLDSFIAEFACQKIKEFDNGMFLPFHRLSYIKIALDEKYEVAAIMLDLEK